MRPLLLLILCLCYCTAGAQTGDRISPELESLNSPYASIYNHLYYLQEESYSAEKAARSLDPTGISAAKRRALAVELKQVMDGKGYLIDLEKIAKDTDYMDTVSGRQRFYPIAQEGNIYLERQGQEWRYSQETVAKIDRMHAEVYPFGTDRLLNLLPKFGTYSFLGLQLWQYLAILILIVFFILFHKILAFVLRELISNILLSLGYERLAREFVYKVARPISIALILTMLLVVIPLLQFSVGFNAFIISAIRIIRPLFVVIIFWRLVNVLAFYLSLAAEKTASTLDDQLIPLVSKILQFIVVVIGIIWAVTEMGVNLAALLAGVSIGGLAIALAAQDTIKHLFGSFMIFVDKPFQIGDWIVTDKIDGSVEKVGLRLTQVRTFHNSVISVPNGKLADMTIDNMGLRQYRRLSTTITITYDTPPALIDKFQEGIRKIITDHPDTWKGMFHVYLNNMSAYSLDILLYCFFSVPDWGAELKARNEILRSVILLADELGVRFAFPTQTVHMESMPDNINIRHSPNDSPLKN